LLPCGLQDHLKFKSVRIISQRFKTTRKHVESVADDEQASVEMQITLLDPPPGFVFGAFKPVKPGACSQRHSCRPYLVPLAPRPETEIKDDIQTEFHASSPAIVDQLRYTLVEFRKLIDGRIIAIQTRHPFVMTEANGRQLPL